MDFEKILVDMYALERTNNKDEIRNRKKYYLRIRKVNDKTEIKIYYNGILMYQYSEDQGFTLNPAVFVPNTRNIFDNNEMIKSFDIEIPSKLKEDANVIEKYFDFFVGTKRNKNISFRLVNRWNKASQEMRNKVLDIVKEKIGFKTTISGSEDNSSLKLLLDSNIISFDDIYWLCIKLLKLTICDGVFDDSYTKKFRDRYFGSPSLVLSCKVKDEIDNEEDFTSMLKEVNKVMKHRIDTYVLEHDYINNEGICFELRNTKSESNQEKAMQQNFMCMLNRLDKDIKFDDGRVLYSKNAYPFELEYIMYAGKIKNETISLDVDDDEKRSQSNIKGRIDNVAVDENKLRLIEIKYGNCVISGTNGIHKHLMDMYSCLKISKCETMSEFENRICVRNSILNRNAEVDLNDEIIYDIICIYDGSDDCKECNSLSAVIEKLNEIYMLPCSKVGLGLDEEKKYSDGGSVRTYDIKLKEKTINDLINMCKEEVGCLVRIILVDSEFKKFEEYKFKG